MRFFTPLALILSILFIELQARNIDDMLGRNVDIPTHPQRVYAAAPFGCFALYAIDPSLLVGWIFPIYKEQLPYLDKSMQTLPTIGRIFGAGRTANLEVLLSHHPDLVLMWFRSEEFTAKEEDKLKLLNTPVVYAKEDSTLDYPKIFRFLGDVLNREKRAEELASYTEEVFQKVSLYLKSIKDSKPPRVYYAEGIDGLLTECDNSIHAELLQMAGDVNVHRCKSSSAKGFEKISMERLMQYNPEVIFVQEKMFYDEIYNKPLWANIDAVKNNRVHMIPRSPFNWFDRPPSFMRIIGLQWSMSHIYPDKFDIDIKQETKKFYKLFLSVDITDTQADSILRGE